MTSIIDDVETPIISQIPVSTKQKAMVGLLVRHGLDLAAALNPDANSLHWAVRVGREDLCKSILEVTAGAARNASGGQRNVSPLIEVKGKFGRTPLWMAAAQNKPGICRILLAAGADVHAACPFDISKDSKVLVSPVGAASLAGNADIVSLLVELGANVDIANPSHHTPLSIAAAHGNLEACRILLANKARHDYTYNDGKDTVLLLAARAGHGLVVAFLLEEGVRAWPLSRTSTLLGTFFDTSVEFKMRAYIIGILKLKSI
jgi:ankyrin repeat protein